MRRLVLEAAEDDVRDGGGWLEIQVDPSGYAARFGGITAFTDLVLDAVRAAVGADRARRWRWSIAANRTRHPLDARTLARLAAQYAGRGVVGFGLSNDERRGLHRRLRAARSGSPSGPGCCWCRTAASCAARSTSPSASTRCTPSGSATASARPRTRRCSTGSSPPASRSRSARSPTSRSASTPTSPRCRSRPCSRPGATVALGADDPLLFGSRLAGQYATMRAAHDLSDEQLAELARMSVRASAAPDDVRTPAAGRHRRLAPAIIGAVSDPATRPAPFTHRPYGGDARRQPVRVAVGAGRAALGTVVRHAASHRPRRTSGRCRTAQPRRASPGPAAVAGRLGARPTARRMPGRSTTRARPPSLVLGHRLDRLAGAGAFICCSSRSRASCARRSRGAIGAKAKREIDAVPGHLRQPAAAVDRHVDGDRDDRRSASLAIAAFVALVAWIGITDPSLV